MANEEIIEGLLIYLEEAEINVTKLVKEVGLKKYKKFQKALDEAIDEFGTKK